MKSLVDYINESNEVELVSDGNEHGFEYVDLGLPSGTMWATCNVGADKPEDEGLLFQFGRVDGYVYNDSNNQFRTDDQNFEDTGSENIPLTTSGKVYKRNEILDLEDDAAHVNMGGKWMMPTNDQLEELYNNTECSIVTINGVKGMLITSDINGHQLFIPFMKGCWYCSEYVREGISTYMWSSQISGSNNVGAYMLFCNFGGVANTGIANRSNGFSVRGVFKK